MVTQEHISLTISQRRGVDQAIFFREPVSRFVSGMESRYGPADPDCAKEALGRCNKRCILATPHLLGCELTARSRRAEEDEAFTNS